MDTASQQRMDANEGLFFVSIRGLFSEAAAAGEIHNHEWTLMDTNEGPFFASIRVYSRFIFLWLPPTERFTTTNGHQCARMKDPFFVSIRVYSRFIFPRPPPTERFTNYELTRMHTNEGPFRVYSRLFVVHFLTYSFPFVVNRANAKLRPRPCTSAKWIHNMA
jgi:hypothetical protein